MPTYNIPNISVDIVDPVIVPNGVAGFRYENGVSTGEFQCTVNLVSVGATIKSITLSSMIAPDIFNKTSDQANTLLSQWLVLQMEDFII